MRVLVTGAAGFIGSYTCHALLDRGWTVTGVDCLNAYYDPALKQDRLRFLEARDGFTFTKVDLSDAAAVANIGSAFDIVIHLAAQAGVRYSLENPLSYVDSNVRAHLNVLELVRHAETPPFLIYASSSSVYGDTTPAPFQETARADQPVSLYAATKRSCELLSESYTAVFDLAQVGLRFFTVYGPWGRPDMAYWSFAERMAKGEPIDVFNNGKLGRDFTWIDDVIDGIVRIAEGGPTPGEARGRHRVYNIGNSRPEPLMHFIEVLERAMGMTATKVMLPMQPGDVHQTAADTGHLAEDYGFAATTSIETGLPIFADWFNSWRSGKAVSTWRHW
ncbi:NAD-dependent epimerase/dehydratase family protein [Parvularcula bermudensis HTCC2503]|uniref:NAD-dependent epimerase/dehydratase family protein n=1 Tax=Parvularcula bermudensis (strain ATCC BAA-594 / HTCC2503 / KCTC 12087) TaxID=314260 RepID=E0TET8_PARBH|nr:NAD-dependent epimerase/dehydratase family protein [Parvularcula bermudensis]ADM09510.1 NAD-dependent epimerase/dehydratase family protein [Parvularcula bermudensis HTCC2503]